jgi:hypothetical protein
VNIKERLEEARSKMFRDNASYHEYADAAFSGVMYLVMSLEPKERRTFFGTHDIMASVIRDLQTLQEKDSFLGKRYGEQAVKLQAELDEWKAISPRPDPV